MFNILRLFWVTAVSRRQVILMAMIVSQLGWWQAVQPLQAVTFTVNSTDDVNDINPGDGLCDDGNGRCTLRAAVSETNALAGEDIIILPAEVYILSIPTSNENNNVNGDLDIRDSLTIRGAGMENTIVDANLKYRVFEIPAGADITVTIEDLTIRNGETGSFGGGLRNNGNTVIINRCSIRDNFADEDGGGIQNEIGGTVTLNDSVITNNSALDDGGGIQDFGGVVTLNNSTIDSNQASGGPSNDGGGIYSLGDLVVNNSTIRNNRADRDGGGIYNADGLTVLNNSTIDNNIAGDDGGGINNNNNTVLIKNSTISNNAASGDPADGLTEGGGIYAFATMDIVNSTISGNGASGGSMESAGGGVFNDGSTRIYNSTLSGNSVHDSPVLSGGGIHNDGNPDTVVLHNNIITNSIGDDCSNTGMAGAFSGSNNLIDDNVSGPCSAISAEAVTAFDSSLGNNTGPTQTHALFAGSNAIDAGVDNCPDHLEVALPVDQRGIARPRGMACDIGAVEFVVFQKIYLPFIEH